MDNLKRNLALAQEFDLPIELVIESQKLAAIPKAEFEQLMEEATATGKIENLVPEKILQSWKVKRCKN